MTTLGKRGVMKKRVRCEGSGDRPVLPASRCWCCGQRVKLDGAVMVAHARPVLMPVFGPQVQVR